MRWLLLKDLQILRRSPLLVALLVLYPVIIAVLIGFALSRGPDKPRGRLLQRPRGQVGGGRPGRRPHRPREGGLAPVRRYRPGAREQQGGGDPEGQGRRRARRAHHPERPGVEHPVAARARGRSRSTTTPRTRRSSQFVENTIKAQVQTANGALTKRVAKEALQLLALISKGGEYSFLGQNFDVLGLKNAETILAKARRRAPARLRRARPARPRDRVRAARAREPVVLGRRAGRRGRADPREGRPR